MSVCNVAIVLRSRVPLSFLSPPARQRGEGAGEHRAMAVRVFTSTPLLKCRSEPAKHSTGCGTVSQLNPCLDSIPHVRALARPILAEADRGRARRRRNACAGVPAGSKDEIGRRMVRRAAFQCASAGALLTGAGRVLRVDAGPDRLAQPDPLLNRLVLASRPFMPPPARVRTDRRARRGSAAGLGPEVLRQGSSSCCGELCPAASRRGRSPARSAARPSGSARPSRWAASPGHLRRRGLPLGETVSRDTADTLIVGGGLIGCALAGELARRGRSVTVIERDEPGAEASGAAAGMLTPQGEARAPGPFFDLALESRDLYPAWARELHEETGIDVGYRRMGLLQCAFDAAACQRDRESYRWQRERGLRVEERSRASRGRSGRAPFADVARAVFFPDEAAVDSRLLTRRGLAVGRARGVRFVTGAAVTRFRVENGVCRGAETEAGASRPPSSSTPRAPGRPSIPGSRFRSARVRSDRAGARGGRAASTLVCSDEVYCTRADGTVLLASTVEFVGFRKEVHRGGGSGCCWPRPRGSCLRSRRRGS